VQPRSAPGQTQRCLINVRITPQADLSAGIKVQTEYAWGVNKAVERYGRSEHLHGAPQPKGSPFPKDPEGRPADKTFNDVPNDWRRGAGESGKPKR
jgi:hypothetical protein